MQVINFHPTSLKNRIAKASTENEIDQLLAEGKGYQFASPNTRGKWKKVAKLQTEELKAQLNKKAEKIEKAEKQADIASPAEAKRKPGRPRKAKESKNG